MQDLRNSAQLLGNVGEEVKSGVTERGTWASFSLATNETWKDAKGEQQKRTEWHKIACFGKTAELAIAYISKGDRVLLEGRIRSNSYTDKEGVSRVKNFIEANKLLFLTQSKKEDAKAASEIDDEIPF